MATTTTTERKPSTRRPKAEHLSMCHPALDHPHVWVAAYLANLAERVAMEHLRKKVYEKIDVVTQLALHQSDTEYHYRIHQNSERVRDKGLLLYAWPGTKLFTNPEARH